MTWTGRRIACAILGLTLLASGCARDQVEGHREMTSLVGPGPDPAAAVEEPRVATTAFLGTNRGEEPAADAKKPAAGPVRLPPIPKPAEPAGQAEEAPLPPGVLAGDGDPRPPSIPASRELIPPPQPLPPSQPITLHVDDTDVRKVLEMLSRQAKENILVSPNVAGSVTLDLRGMSLDDALQAIATLCHISFKRRDGAVYVYTTAEIDQVEEEDLPVRVYRLNHVRGPDLEKMVKPILSKRGVVSSSPESEVGIKSNDEKAGGDSPGGNDVLIVQDHERILKRVDRVIEQIDVQPVQVLIEAVIVAVKLENGMDLGVNFAVLDGAQNALTVAGSGAAINAAAGFTPATVITTAGKVVGDTTSGFAENSQGLKFGFVDNTVTGFLRALESLGETEILACPRLLVLNKQRAELQLGDRLGYKTLTQTQTSTVEQVQFMDVGTQLRLRPFITSDGMVRMEVHPEKSTGKVDLAGVPQTNNAQVTTNVMVPDGATIVIGGLMETEREVDEKGIPLLCRIPYLGILFRHNVTTTTRKELIVILTPHIWNPASPGSLNGLPQPRCLEELPARAGVDAIVCPKRPPIAEALR